MPPAPSSATMSTQSADFPPIAPLDVPAPGDRPSPPPVSAPPAGPPPPPVPSPPANGGRPQAAPSSFGANASKSVPPVAVAQYDVRTGRYVGPDGKLYQQSDLVPPKAPKRWQDMLPT